MTRTETHVHRWRIGERTPHNRYSPGECRCGAARMFDNWAVDERVEGSWKDKSEANKRQKGMVA